MSSLLLCSAFAVVFYISPYNTRQHLETTSRSSLLWICCKVMKRLDPFALHKWYKQAIGKVWCYGNVVTLKKPNPNHYVIMPWHYYDIVITVLDYSTAGSGPLPLSFAVKYWGEGDTLPINPHIYELIRNAWVMGQKSQRLGKMFLPSVCLGKREMASLSSRAASDSILQNKESSIPIAVFLGL